MQTEATRLPVFNGRPRDGGDGMLVSGHPVFAISTHGVGVALIIEQLRRQEKPSAPATPTKPIVEGLGTSSTRGNIGMLSLPVDSPGGLAEGAAP